MSSAAALHLKRVQQRIHHLETQIEEEKIELRLRALPIDSARWYRPFFSLNRYYSPRLQPNAALLCLRLRPTKGKNWATNATLYETLLIRRSLAPPRLLVP